MLHDLFAVPFEEIEPIVGARSRSRAWSPTSAPALVNGVAGVVVVPEGQPFSVIAFTVAGGRVVAIDALTDPERLAELDLTVLDA